MVFPAQAGVILTVFLPVILSIRIPRASGGDPVMRSIMNHMMKYSPRKRG